MADSKASTAKKAERKKPVRKAPVQKDYPTRLDWLRAMTAYEVQQSDASTVAKTKRLDKRIDARKHTIDTLTAELAKLEAERASLVGADEAGDEPEAPAPDVPA